MIQCKLNVLHTIAQGQEFEVHGYLLTILHSKIKWASTSGKTVSMAKIFIFLYFIGIFFVVDSTNRNRFQEGYDWLKTRILQEELFDGIPLIILANKREKRKSASIEEIAQAFHLHEINQSRYGQQGIQSRFCENLLK